MQNTLLIPLLFVAPVTDISGQKKKLLSPACACSQGGGSFKQGPDDAEAYGGMQYKLQNCKHGLSRGPNSINLC